MNLLTLTWFELHLVIIAFKSVILTLPRRGLKFRAFGSISRAMILRRPDKLYPIIVTHYIEKSRYVVHQ